MGNSTTLIKDPYVKTVFETQQQLDDFIKCCDPETGYLYFMDNFFIIQHPTKGSMNYHPYPYQRRLIETYHNYRYSIALMPRQSGKSTSAAGYLLWYAMFVPDSTVLIAAHKYTGAQEIMQRIRYAYENCPMHIKAGVTTYNKGSLDFENGSRIVSATTTENTGRGMSISLLYLDEFAFVRPSIAELFWTSITPTLATGGKAIITSTPNSDEDQFALIWKGANKCLDEFGNPTEMGVNGFKAYRASWTEQPGRDQKWADDMKSKLGEDKFNREIGCFSGDTMITVRDNNQRILTISMRELENMLVHNKSSTVKVLNQKDSYMEELIKNSLNLEILTDSGWEKFDGLTNKGVMHTITIKLEGTEVTLTPDHHVFLNTLEKIPADKLKSGDLVLTLSGIKKILSIKENKLETVYDLVNVGKNKRFYASEVLCSNCEFIVADETLINPNTLLMLESVEPEFKHGQVRWFSKPKKGNIYAVGLDPSLGTGGDPAAIQIFDATNTTQIGEWKHNRTDIPNQIKLLADINRYIVECTDEPNNLYYSIENNSIGEASLISLNEYGEHNIVGTFLSERGKKRKGFTTTHKSKLAACAKLKTLIESKKMKIQSKASISELKTFIAHGGSYAAKIGETDDLIMSTLLVIRMIQLLGEYHGDLESQIRDHEDYVAPMPFFAVYS